MSAFSKPRKIVIVLMILAVPTFLIYMGYQELKIHKDYSSIFGNGVSESGVKVLRIASFECWRPFVRCRRSTILFVDGQFEASSGFSKGKNNCFSEIFEQEFSESPRFARISEVVTQRLGDSYFWYASSTGPEYVFISQDMDLLVVFSIYPETRCYK